MMNYEVKAENVTQPQTTDGYSEGLPTT